MTPLAALVRFQSEIRRPAWDRELAVLQAVVAALAPPSSSKVRRALAYLEQHPDATANAAAGFIGGRRADALAAVRDARRLIGTNGNQFPRHASVRPTSDPSRQRVRHERPS